MTGDYLNIDWLMANHQIIHFFGLGFIQIKLNDKQRLHFYCDVLPPFVDHPHNHRYDFTSKVLKGSLQSIIWKENPRNNLAVQCTKRYDACSVENKDVPESQTTTCGIVADFCTNADSSYFMPKELFHQVRANVSPTITFLSRGPKEYEFASILEPIDYKPVCPFSGNLSPDKLWEIVRSCLND